MHRTNNYMLAQKKKVKQTNPPPQKKTHPENPPEKRNTEQKSELVSFSKNQIYRG